MNLQQFLSSNIALAGQLFKGNKHTKHSLESSFVLRLFFRGVIRLDGFCLDDNGSVAALIVLALVRD